VSCDKKRLARRRRRHDQSDLGDGLAEAIAVYRGREIIAAEPQRPA
jgi:hypothetical protein